MKILDSVFVYRLAGGDRLSWHGRYHAHGAGEYEIHFFLEGNGSFLCNRTRYPVSGGRLFLSGPREFHSILPETVSVPMTYYAVLFSVDTDPASPDARCTTRWMPVLTVARPSFPLIVIFVSSLRICFR